MGRRIASAFAAIALLVAQLGCASGTADAYRRLQVGHSVAQVRSILGLGDRYPPGITTMKNAHGTTEVWTLCWDWINGWHRSCNGNVMAGPVTIVIQNDYVVSITHPGA